MKKMDSKQEGTFAIIAALLALFAAMWDPLISIIVVIAFLMLYATYRIIQK